MAYKCETCGQTSEEKKECCGVEMQEVAEEKASGDATEEDNL